jgi:hypothetical protein
MSGKKKAQKAAASATTTANQASSQAASQANSQTNAAVAEADSAAAQAGSDVGSPNVDPNATRGPGGRILQFENFSSDYIPAFPYLSDQLILNSGRVLLNSKYDSTMLFGKRSIALSSDGTLNFDSRLKYIVNSPRIELGLGDNASVALGEPLIEYLDKLSTGLSDLAKELEKVFNTGNNSPFQGVNIQAGRLVKKLEELNAVKTDLKSNVVFVGKNIVTTAAPSVTEEVQEPSQPSPGNSEGGYTSKGDQQNEADQQDRKDKSDRFENAKGKGIGAEENERSNDYSPGSQDTLNSNTGPSNNSNTNQPAPSQIRRTGEDNGSQAIAPAPQEDNPSTYRQQRPSPTPAEEL